MCRCFCGVGVRMCRREGTFLERKLLIVPLGERTPRQEFRFPQPKSRSMATTGRFLVPNCWARLRERLAVITVLPTPPLPLAIATVRAFLG